MMDKIVRVLLALFVFTNAQNTFAILDLIEEGCPGPFLRPQSQAFPGNGISYGNLQALTQQAWEVGAKKFNFALLPDQRPDVFLSALKKVVGAEKKQFIELWLGTKTPKEHLWLKVQAEVGSHTPFVLLAVDLESSDFTLPHHAFPLNSMKLAGRNAILMAADALSEHTGVPAISLHEEAVSQATEVTLFNFKPGALMVAPVLEVLVTITAPTISAAISKRLNAVVLAHLVWDEIAGQVRVGTTDVVFAGN